MSDESKKNIVHVCSDCIDERTKKFQENFDENMGDFMTQFHRQGRGFLKTGFVIEKGKPDREHMWVQVSSIADINFDTQTVTGKLNNEPMYVTDVKLHDEVVVPFADISDFLA